MTRFSARLLLVLLGLHATSAISPAQEPIWIEGEAATTANVKLNLAGWGNKSILSGEKWLNLSVDADKVDKDVPGDGALLSYKFTVKTDGTFAVWNRLGFEFVRSPFDWRIDGGAWTRSRPDELTTDLMELDFFCEVAWLKLGDKALTRGEHALEIRIPKLKDEKGQTARILYSSDAIVLHPGTFLPNGPFPPGNDGRDARDKQAGTTVFRLPEPKSAADRASVSLRGLWEIARDDEQMPGEVAEPIKALPAHPFWRGIEVPSDKNTSRPDFVFAHRVWYRTRVDVPKSAAGRSFFLVFPQNNLNTTVYVNGKFCGFDKNPFARVQIDVTRAVKPGENEVWVGIRDAWYGRAADPENPLKLRKTFNLPKKFFSDGFQDLAYPVWNQPQSGILVTPEFVSAGPAYVADTFVKPSVARKELAVDLTIGNPADKAVDGEIVVAAIDSRGAHPLMFSGNRFTIKAGSTQSLSVKSPWPAPRLWWPDDPAMYTLQVTLVVDGKPVDVSETPFGFREWTIDGKDFKLNGIPWHGWADTHSEETPKDWLDFYHKSNQTFMRFWGTSWQNLPPDQALDFFDKNGVVVRRSGILDGEAIGYHAVEQDEKFRKKRGTEVKMDLLENWRDQVVAQVKGERNHPSVMIWSIENEYLYINCINLHGGLMDKFEEEIVKTADAVKLADPTRPSMTDGGGATKSNKMPVHGDHYTSGPFSEYPTLAYTPNTKGGGRGRWEWDQKRPRFIGEELFAEGFNPSYSYFGGEEVFSGKAGSRRAVGLLVRMMTEGGRWTGNGAIHFWQGPSVAVGQYDGNAPRAVLCRQWDWTFGPEQSVKRTFGIFNDTHSAEPITFTRTLTIKGKAISAKTTEHKVPPGENVKFDETIAMPGVPMRTEGELLLTLSVAGKEVYRDVKSVTVLPPRKGIGGLKPGDIAVYDPKGEAKAFLGENAIPFAELGSLKNLPDAAKILLIGRDALDASESTSTALAAYALSGKRVIVLEQKHPLKYQALQPAEMESATNEGRIAFVEDASHTAMRLLKSKDFFTWGPDEVVYRDAYLKPTRGARSIVQCNDQLKNSAMVEIPIGKGFLLVSQLRIGETLPTNAVAQSLLSNLIRHGVEYKQEFRQVAAVVDGSPRLAEALDATGLKYESISDPVQALTTPTITLVVMNASPANLKTVYDNRDALSKFKARGGYLVLNGLTPEGLDAFNKLVGVEHMIRPFRRERVMFPALRDPLAAGLSLGDVALYSSERIFPWQEGNFVAGDTFSHVVDYDDVAPFARLFDRDGFAANMVNGFVSSDAWKYIVNIPVPKEGPMDFLLDLPKSQTISEVEWIGNTFYYPVTKFELLFDGKETASYKVKPINDPQTFAVDPPRSGKNLTLRLAEWDKLPGKGAVTGLDNIRLKPVRSAEFLAKVKPLINCGGLMHYPDGEGGIVLCNVLFKTSEDVPGNAEKKRAVLATILRNLKAPFAAGKTVIAGASLDYAPIDLSKQANQYRTERGWFGDANTTFKDLPSGKQTFAGVPFSVYDFRTSPVPTVVMLGGQGVPNNLADAVRGIPVNRKADALFFLQAARIDQRRNDQEVREKKQFEMARYVVTFADGKTAEIPVISEIDVDDYKQRSPSPLPGAQIGWTKPFANSDLSAVAYVKQWNNPRPDVAIKSVDLVYGKDRRGVPALIAVTAATARP
ncbi:MAG: Beta-galactosidase/beta-glucuronidase [Planctomycetota bacterium]|nr:Beta-galactosidase/beta-glucuronidase [Planctomycetota bacterium]